MPRAFGVAAGLDPEVARPLAARCAELGYDSIWLTETRFTRDAITCAAAVATATSHVRVGTAVINPFTRGDVQGGIVIPSGAAPGEGFMTYANFNAIRRYNPSDFYALAVGLLADASA